MSAFLCTLGIHKWEVVREREMWEGSEHIVFKDALRQCKRCGKMQKEDYHCLGLNPPQFVSNWYDIDY